MSWSWTVAPGAESLARTLASSESAWFPPSHPEKENGVRALFRHDGLYCKYFKKRCDQAESV